MRNDEIIKDDIQKVLSSDFIDYGKLSSANYLVTGSSGMLCSFVVKVLLSLTSGKVFALFRNKQRFDEVFSSFLGNQNLVPIECDVAKFDPSIIRDRVDHIIHGASIGSPKFYTIDPLDVFEANCIGTLKMIDLMKIQPVKDLTFISSAEVYGDITELDSVAEDYVGVINQLEVRSCYAESKRMAENIVASWCKTNGRNFNIVRPFHTYGPDMKLDDGRIFADVVKAVVSGEDIVLNSDGSSVRAFCYVVDFVSALLAIIASGKVNEVWNIGNADEVFSTADLAYMVQNIILEKKVNVIIKNDTQKSNSFQKIIPDISKLKSLGWYNQVNAKSGFTRIINHFLNNL
jgi:nucleoside-diphosphate-sugar epimerase